MRMRLVAIFLGVSFALCCECFVWPFMAYGSELSAESEPVVDATTSGPAASEDEITTDDVAGPVMLAAPSLAASATTLDTVNNNVLALHGLFGNAAFFWPGWSYQADDGSYVAVNMTLRQWLVLDSVSADGHTITTLLGHAKHADQQLTEAELWRLKLVHADTISAVQKLESIQSDVVSVRNDVTEIKRSLNDSSGDTVKIDDDQWQVLSDTVKFQNFALLVLTLLSSASIGCSLWGYFSKGWRK